MGWVVNATSRPLYPRELPSTHCTMGGPQGRCGRVRNISPPNGIRSPDRPARSKSLYRLSHPGPLIFVQHIWNWQQVLKWYPLLKLLHLKRCVLSRFVRPSHLSSFNRPNRPVKRTVLVNNAAHCVMFSSFVYHFLQLSEIPKGRY